MNDQYPPRRPAGRYLYPHVLAVLAGVLALSCVRLTPSAPPTVLEPQSGEECRQIIRTSRRPVLVAFTSESCVTCRTMRPALQSLAEDYAGRLTVVHADLGKTGELIGEYDLIKVPTVVVLRDGKELARRHGLLPAPFMGPFIRDALQQP